MRIGITGKKRAGKDTIAQYLVQHYGFQRIGFADAVKQMAMVLNPELWDEDYSDPYLYQLKDVVDMSGWEKAKERPEVRQYLQVLGTEAVRNIIGEDAWVKAALKKVQDKGWKDVVFSDVRFDNEAEICDYVIEVVNPSCDTGDSHASEQGIDRRLIGSTVINDGSLEELYVKVDEVMRMLGRGKN